jgi:hypothetical protein
MKLIVLLGQLLLTTSGLLVFAGTLIYTALVIVGFV